MNPIDWADSATRYVTRGHATGYATMTRAQRQEIWRAGLDAFRESNPLEQDELPQVVEHLTVAGFLDAADILAEDLVQLQENALGDRIAELRRQEDLTTEELVDRINEEAGEIIVDEAAVEAIEAGELVSVSPALIAAIAAVFTIPDTGLLDLVEPVDSELPPDAEPSPDADPEEVAEVPSILADIAEPGQVHTQEFLD